ncbi:MAG TPA: o-succinylbenzoate synthase [Jiangellales bacterium]|nr:o-succinylbenzoate synthase [Jiangellales bacterium]
MHVYAIPLRTRFRGIEVRDGVLVRGPAGWGEFSPFHEYDDAESTAWWRAAREAADDGWPPPVRRWIPVNATVPAVASEDVADVLARFPGCSTAKVKVAAAHQAPAADEDRLRAVRDRLGPDGRIRVDVNGAWDVETATKLLPRYDRAAGGLEYAEQPCRTVDELAAVRRKLDIPIAADESIRRAGDPLLVASRAAADVAVLKVQPLGGVRACLRIAEQIGLPVVVSSALETSIGIAAGVALAAALPELPYACGLATVGLLACDVVDEPLVAVDGAVPVRRPIPSDARLAAVRADEATATWWSDRVSRISKRS